MRRDVGPAGFSHGRFPGSLTHAGWVAWPTASGGTGLEDSRSAERSEDVCGEAWSGAAGDHLDGLRRGPGRRLGRHLRRGDAGTGRHRRAREVRALRTLPDRRHPTARADRRRRRRGRQHRRAHPDRWRGRRAGGRHRRRREPHGRQHHGGRLRPGLPDRARPPSGRRPTSTSSPPDRSCRAWWSCPSATEGGSASTSRSALTSSSTCSDTSCPPRARRPAGTCRPRHPLAWSTAATAPASPLPASSAAGDTRVVQVTGRAGVPASGVTAVAVNLTVTETGGPGFLTVTPNGAPTVSNVNVDHAGATRANFAIVPRRRQRSGAAVHAVGRRTSWSTWPGGSPTAPLRPRARACSCRSRRPGARHLLRSQAGGRQLAEGDACVRRSA